MLLDIQTGVDSFLFAIRIKGTCYYVSLLYVRAINEGFISF